VQRRRVVRPAGPLDPMGLDGLRRCFSPGGAEGRVRLYRKFRKPIIPLKAGSAQAEPKSTPHSTRQTGTSIAGYNQMRWRFRDSVNVVQRGLR
jgi:hypothetical protein